MVKVSIVTICYNAEATIRECLASVGRQDYGSIEYIVIDGGSTDNTLDILSEYNDVIDVLVSEPDSGIYDALNKGVSKATGDIVGFMHSDDAYSNNGVVSLIVSAFDVYGVSGVYGDLIYISPNKNGQVFRYWKSCPVENVLIKYAWMPPHPTLYLRRSVYDEIGGFDVSFKISGDYDFTVRLFKCLSYTFYYISHPLVSMKVGGISNRSPRFLLLKSCEDFKVLRSNGFSWIVSFMLIVTKNLSKLKQFFFKADLLQKSGKL